MMMWLSEWAMTAVFTAFYFMFFGSEGEGVFKTKV